MNKLNVLTHEGTFKDNADGTVKAVYGSKNGVMEISFITNKLSRGTDVYCVPTHHNCTLGCTFCHLTQANGITSMIPVSKEELHEAIVRTAHKKCEYNPLLRRTSSRKALLSFMGAGEPLLNLELITTIFEDEQTLKRTCGYEQVSYALATMMPNKNLENLADYAAERKLPLKVHYSMHTPFTEERQKLIPRSKVAVRDALQILDSYRQKVNRVNDIMLNISNFHTVPEVVEIHYTLIDRVNDSRQHLNMLAELAAEYKIPVKFLRFNPTSGLQESTRINEWLEALQKKGVRAKAYSPPGRQVGSSCGQFTKYYYLPEAEREEASFNNWKALCAISE